ncbi:uncharacterized protein BDR25DRAFT_191156, partial [Lindgomyces ingoldianus]
LIIVRIENFRHMSEGLGAWRHIRRDYKLCGNGFMHRRLVFKQKPHPPLRPIIDATARVNGLIADPGGKGWSDKDIYPALESRLGDFLNSSISAIEKITQIFNTLKEELTYNRASVQASVAWGKASISGGKRGGGVSVGQPQTLPNRVRNIPGEIRTRRSERERLFKDFQNYNDRLRVPLKNSDDIGALNFLLPVSAEFVRAEAIMAGASIRATRLFAAIAKSWQCPCQPHHLSNLFLENRTLNVDFNLIFH